MPKLPDFLRKHTTAWMKCRRLVMAQDETVMAEEDGVVIGPARVVDPAARLGYALLFVAFVVDFGIADYFGLPIPKAVGGWAWGFGMAFVVPKLVSWGNRRRWRIIPVSLRVKVKGVPTVEKRVIRAKEDKKKPQAKE